MAVHRAMEIPKEIYRDERITDAECRVLGIILLFVPWKNPRKVSIPAMKTIVEHSGKSRTAVYRAIQGLVQKDVLERATDDQGVAGFRLTTCPDIGTNRPDIGTADPDIGTGKSHIRDSPHYRNHELNHAVGPPPTAAKVAPARINGAPQRVGPKEKHNRGGEQLGLEDCSKTAMDLRVDKLWGQYEKGWSIVAGTLGERHDFHETSPPELSNYHRKQVKAVARNYTDEQILHAMDRKFQFARDKQHHLGSCIPSYVFNAEDIEKQLSRILAQAPVPGERRV